MTDSSRSVRRPKSLRESQASFLALGISAALIAGPVFAQGTDEETIELDTFRGLPFA